MTRSYQAHHQELYAFSVSDNLVAAGGQGDVHFWDRRTQQRLASFDDMHMDDVTQVGRLAAVRSAARICMVAEACMCVSKQQQACWRSRQTSLLLYPSTHRQKQHDMRGC